MRRFLLFAAPRPLIQGGFDDFISDFDSVEDAEKYFYSLRISSNPKVWYWN